MSNYNLKRRVLKLTKEIVIASGNKGKIKDHSIKEQTIIKRPKEKNDIIAICLFEIKLNNEN